MKNLFMLAAMMATTIAASAQFYVGGTLGLSTSKNEYEIDFGANVSMSTTDYGICPETGYNFTDASKPDNKVTQFSFNSTSVQLGIQVAL